MRFAFGCVLLLAILCVPANEAHAARFMAAHIAIQVDDGEIVLKAGTGDNGDAAEDKVWQYLRKIEFPGQLGGKAGSEPFFRIVPDKGSPLQATITGNIEVGIRYGKTAKTKSLRLIRNDANSTKWHIHPDDFEALTKVAK